VFGLLLIFGHVGAIFVHQPQAKPGHQPHFELDFGTAGSNVTLTGLAHWGFLHGTGTYECGPDGKPIEQPPKPGS
jgi:hypothetical protein